jgi:SpoVK/Ycf46/Vps4 family AAA+-type ATPase
LNDIQNNGAILEGLELVFHLITKFEVVEQLYLRKPSSVHAQLDDCIVSLYGAILEYLLDARQYFAQKKTLRIVKSVFQLEDMRTKYVSNIQARAKKVDEYVHLIADEMADQTSSILKAALSDLEEPIRRICSHISEIEDKLKENERLRIFEWLTSIEYSNHHRTKTKMLLPDSGKWLLRKKEFQNWMASSNSSILWLHGIPGSGKSMLVAHVIEYIKNRNAKELSPGR